MFKRLLPAFGLLIALMVAPALAFAAEHQGMSAEGHGAEVHHAPPLVPANGEEMKEVLPTAIWVLVIFVILLIVLYRTAWKNVLTGLKAREQRIRGDIAEAEAARARAEATLKEYNAQLATAEEKVRAILSKATADAQQVADSIRTRAEQEAQERKERSEQEIQRATADAISQIHEQAADLVTSIAEKVVPHILTGDDRQALVNRSLDELRAVSGRN